MACVTVYFFKPTPVNNLTAIHKCGYMHGCLVLSCEVCISSHSFLLYCTGFCQFPLYLHVVTCITGLNTSFYFSSSSDLVICHSQNKQVWYGNAGQPSTTWTQELLKKYVPSHSSDWQFRRPPVWFPVVPGDDGLWMLQLRWPLSSLLFPCAH